MDGLFRLVRRISGPKGKVTEFVVWQGHPEEWVNKYTHFRCEHGASIMEDFEKPEPGKGWVRVDVPEWVGVTPCKEIEKPFFDNFLSILAHVFVATGFSKRLW